MSADDPTDDELEREARADVPIASRKHGPKLGTESRAINPRELLEAERYGQSQDPLEGAYQAGAPRRPFGEPRPTHAMTREPAPRQDQPAMRGRVMPFRRREPPPTLEPFVPDGIWDRYLIAAIALTDTVEAAAELADMMLEERRRRFG